MDTTTNNTETNMDQCKTEGCDNFAGRQGGQCNACRRGERPDPEKRKREEEAAKAYKERKASEKRRKREEKREEQKACGKCGAREVLQLYNKAPDNCYATLPSGVELEGSFPTLPGITHHEGIEVSICVNCGFVLEFDPVAVRHVLAQEEEQANQEE
jgi:hypothetical protein